MKQLVSTICLSILLVFSISCSKDEPVEPIIPVFSLDKQEIIVPKDGGSFTVKVTSNIQWSATSADQWVTLQSEGAAGTADLKFTVSKNDKDEKRTGEITVSFKDEGTKKIKVIQDATPAEKGPDLYVKATGKDSDNGFSWKTATTLSNALKIMEAGDNIHIAAGTYIPTKKITGGDKDRDFTFEINKNVTLIGGYPADAAVGAVADKSNKTILSGDEKFYHTVTITAPVIAGKKVTIKNLSITKGLAGVTADGILEINEGKFDRSFGGGFSIGVSLVDVIDCTISENKSERFAAGVYVHSNAIVNFKNTDIINNKTINEGGNCGGLHNAATSYLTDCNILDNSATGVAGGIYNYHPDKEPVSLYLYNCTVARNTNRGSNAHGVAGGGMYARENSYTRIVNSTFFRNVAYNGGAILIYGAAGKTSTADIINSTFYDNSAEERAGGIMNQANTFLNIHNSILTGNTARVDDNFITQSPATTKFSYVVIGDLVLNSTGGDTGKTFTPNMISALADNGGRTKTCMITASSPAATLGMTSALLQTLGSGFTPPIAADIITKDQAGVSRSGKTAMGAVVPK